MFDLAEERLVWIPCRWRGVVQKKDGALAENIEHEIELQVALVERDEFNAIFRGDDETMSELEKFKTLVRDWRKVKIGKASAPFTDENAQRILKMPMFSTGFDRSYVAAWSGAIEAREKNSDDSSTAGQADGGSEAQTPEATKD